MKKVKAFVRCQKVEAVLNTLEEAGIEGVTLIDVLGLGSYSDPKTAKYSYDCVEKYSNIAKLELVCSSADVHRIVEIIRTTAYSGMKGDGIVFVSPVDMAVIIRTGAVGEDGL
ncbi:MAG: P-II family nitrogen regulator [Rhodothermia bacterium]|nr:MAG: P-II family nitrogen regulator [Rhodothermia bacterium]